MSADDGSRSGALRLGLAVGYAGADLPSVLPLVALAERVGVDSVWTAEAYGADAVTVLSYLAARTERVKLGTAVMQIPARTPAMTAMTAMTLDALSGGRLLLGLGMSGPQVVEGWHGVPYGRPLGRTREYIEIMRTVIAREAPLTYQGEAHQIPFYGEEATDLGKPLKSTLHPLRRTIPIYLAAIGPRNVALAGEVADGWLPLLYSCERESVLVAPLDEGLRRAGRQASGIDVCVPVMAARGDDLDACRDLVRPMLALYIGGMGARGCNFYFDLVCRYGFEAAAAAIQNAYLEGRKAEAAAAVPAELIDEVALVGPLERIIDRLEVWKASRVNTLILATSDPVIIEAAQAAL